MQVILVEMCVFYASRDLNRNKLRSIDGLTFQDLVNLNTLRLKRNNITQLKDGAFFGLKELRKL